VRRQLAGRGRGVLNCLLIAATPPTQGAANPVEFPLLLAQIIVFHGLRQAEKVPKELDAQPLGQCPVVVKLSLVFPPESVKPEKPQYEFTDETENTPAFDFLKDYGILPDSYLQFIKKKLN
jgi:hypothetical protein